MTNTLDKTALEAALDLTMIEQTITEWFGERCKTFDPECFCCKAWAEVEAIRDRLRTPSPQTELTDGGKAGEPVAYIDPKTIEVLAARERWCTAILTHVAGENATMPLYSAATLAAKDTRIAEALDNLGRAIEDADVYKKASSDHLARALSAEAGARQLQDSNSRMAEGWTKLQARIVELEAERDRMTAALKPFAKLNEKLERDYPDYKDYVSVFFDLTHGDFRRAALTKGEASNT